MPPEVAQKPDQLDLSVIASLRELQCPGESDLLGKLSAMFIEDTTRRIALIRAALDERDISVIQREVHSIKGAAGNLGVTSVMDLSRAIEREAENGNALGGLIDQLEDGFHEAAERLTSLCVSV
jgi:FOG: HPt domain